MHTKLLRSLAISLALISSSSCSSSANSPKGVKVHHHAGSSPSFIQASAKLNAAITKLKSGQKSQAIEALNAIRKGAFEKAEDKQIAAFLVADSLSKSSDVKKKREAIAIYQEGFNHRYLGNYARLKAAGLAKSMHDESAVQAILAPMENSIKGVSARSLAKNEKHKLSKSEIASDKIKSELLYRLAESYYRQNKFTPASIVFDNLRKEFPDTKYATGAAFYLGATATKDNDTDPRVALAYFREYLTKSPKGRFAPEAVKTLRALSSSNSQTGAPAKIKLTSQDRNLMAFACYQHTLWKMALEEWSKANYRHILRPICMAKTNQKEAAVNEFIQVAKLDPNNKLIINGATTLSKSLTRKQALRLWTSLYSLPIKRKDEVLKNIAKRNKAKANSYYRKIVFNYPNSVHADDALWWLIWHHVKNSYHTKGANKKAHLTKAAKLCVHGVQKYPNSDLAPMYAFWSGKVHEKLGKRKEAISIYNTTFSKYPNFYYGYRSKYRAIHLNSLLNRGKDKNKKKIVADRGWKTFPKRKSPNPNWHWPEPPKYFQWSALERSIGKTPTLLAWLGQYSQATSFSDYKTPRHLRAWLYRKAGNEMKALSISSYKLKGKPDRSLFWQFNYPLAYAKHVDAESRKHGVDPLLAHALIRQESKYDPEATSRSNAMGLMQLLKGTAYGVAKHNNIKLASTRSIYNPITNIKLGCAYLGYVQRGKNGNSMHAVGSYNGGPNAVKRWVRKFKASGIKDVDYFVENVPYRETRGYIRKVFGNYWNYETIYLKK